MSLYSFCVRHEKKIGSIASFMAIVMFIALIEIFISNLKGESHIFIQPLATSVNGFFWLGYAYARKDIFIAIPNFLAPVLRIATAIAVFV